MFPGGIEHLNPSDTVRSSPLSFPNNPFKCIWQDYRHFAGRPCKTKQGMEAG